MDFFTQVSNLILQSTTVFYFAILPQLVKKVRSDFFDKLKPPLYTAAARFT